MFACCFLVIHLRLAACDSPFNFENHARSTSHFICCICCCCLNTPQQSPPTNSSGGDGCSCSNFGVLVLVYCTTPAAPDLVLFSFNQPQQQTDTFSLMAMLLFEHSFSNASWRHLTIVAAIRQSHASKKMNEISSFICCTTTITTTSV